MIQSAEVRAALGQFKRRPMYAIGATLSLAIGTSLATAVFTVVNSVLLRPLPLPQPDRIGYVYQRAPLADFDFTQTTSRMYQEMAGGAMPAFQQVAAFTR